MATDQNNGHIKGPDDPVTAEDLSEFLDSQSDFGLELFVYSHAREMMFDATHGGSYTDRVTGKSRQYDVRVNAQVAEEFVVRLAIECKCLKPTYPLLVSRIPRLPEESYIYSMAPVIRLSEDVSIGGAGGGSNGTSGSRRHILRDPDVSKHKYPQCLYGPDEFVGKAITQVGHGVTGHGKNTKHKFVSGDSEVFDKWGQAISSAKDLIDQSIERRQGKFMRSVVLPILVVSNDTLWVTDYSENGARDGEPKLINHAHVFIGETYKSQERECLVQLSHLHIITKTGIVEFIKKLRYDTDFVKSICPIEWT